MKGVLTEWLQHDLGPVDEILSLVEDLLVVSELRRQIGGPFRDEDFFSEVDREQSRQDEEALQSTYDHFDLCLIDRLVEVARRCVLYEETREDEDAFLDRMVGVYGEAPSFAEGDA